MPRGVLDVRRDARGNARLSASGTSPDAPTRWRASLAALIITTSALAACHYVHEAMIHVTPSAFLAFPIIGSAWLALCVPLGVLMAYPEDVRRGLNPLKAKDFLELAKTTYRAAGANAGKVRGKDL